MKSLEEYVELSKKLHGDITMIQPKSKKGSGLTSVVKPKRKLKKIEVLPDTYLETRDELVEKQEALLKKYEKIQELRKKARNIPATSLIKEYQQILGKDFVPELNTDPGEVVASYIVRSGPGPSYHYYYRFKQSTSIPIEQYLPLMKEVSCMENKSGDIFTFRFHVYQQQDGTLKIQGLEKFSYDAVMNCFENVFKKTLKSKKKTDIPITKIDYDILNSLGMIDSDNAFLPYNIGDYTVESGNTHIEINRITREKISERGGGGVKPYTFKIIGSDVISPKVDLAIPSPIIETTPKLKELQEKLHQLETMPLADKGTLTRDGKAYRKTKEKRKDRDSAIESVKKQITLEQNRLNEVNKYNEILNKPFSRQDNMRELESILNSEKTTRDEKEVAKSVIEIEKEEIVNEKSDRLIKAKDKKRQENPRINKNLGGKLIWQDSRVKRKYKII